VDGTSVGDARLLPRRLRRPAGALAACGALLAAVLCAWFSGRDGYGRFDGRVLADLRSGLHGHLRPLWWVVDLADPPSLVVATALLALVACLLRAWRVAALAALAMALTGGLVEGLKHLVGRTLDGNLAMPSGHTAGTTALATVLALLVLGRVRPRRPLLAGGGALLAVTALAAGVAVTMTVLRLHYATDTLAGWGTGLAVTLSVALLLDAAARRLAVHRAAPAS
jgi:undecaprenyl-diphosphatase